jgi:hypothetical protein
MSGFTSSTPAVSINPFVGGFDWTGFVLMGLALVAVAFIVSAIVGGLVYWFASDRLLVEHRGPRTPQFCHGRRLNTVSRGELAGLAVFMTVLAFGGSLLVHTERVNSADAIHSVQSDAAVEVAELEDKVKAAEDERDEAIEVTDSAVSGQYEQWLRLLGYEVVDTDPEAETATVEFTNGVRVVSMAGEVPSFIVDDDGNGNVTTVEVQHILILKGIVAGDPDHPFRGVFDESDLAGVPGYVPARPTP